MFQYSREELLMRIVSELLRKHMTVQQASNLLQSAADPGSIPNPALDDLSISLLIPYIQKDDLK